MGIRAEVKIEAPRERVWQLITDIEHATHHVSAIEKIEVLEKPQQGLVGLKWRETRTMFGKTATEIMWITDAAKNDYYETRAESHGAIYRSRLSVTDRDGATVLAMDFEAEPQSFGARLAAATIGKLFEGSTRKALQKDLEDIKAEAEGGAVS